MIKHDKHIAKAKILSTREVNATQVPYISSLVAGCIGSLLP